MMQQKKHPDSLQEPAIFVVHLFALWFTGGENDFVSHSMEVTPRRAMHHCDLISALRVSKHLMKSARGSISVMAVYEGLTVTNQLSKGGGFTGETSIRILIQFK